MSNEIAYTVSAKAQLGVLVSLWPFATKTLRLKAKLSMRRFTDWTIL
jgi:hypothetical protein